jgi:Asp-tRNA(Asn)/Glu-tRNA(Gln) amidotransferase A subunit family amidase
MNEHYRLDASQALALMQKGELTVEEYAKSLLARIKERDHLVKAWAYLDPSFVLEQARALDQIPVQRRGPLHGIAIGVKDVVLTKGIIPFFCQELGLTCIRYANTAQFRDIRR